MLQNLNSFDILLEKMGSFLLRNLTKSEIDHLKQHADLNKLSDKDILKVEDPKILTKKPYTDYDCAILMFGDNEVKGKTVYGLSYHIRNTNVWTGSNNHEHNGRHAKTPARRDLLTNPNFINNYDYYVIFKSKDLEELRKKRQVKYGALLDPNEVTSSNYGDNIGLTNREVFNKDVATKNKDRYAKTIAEKSNYDDYFHKFIELFAKVEKKKIDAIQKHLDFYRENKTVKEYEFLRDFNSESIDKSLLKELEAAKIHIWNKDRDGNIGYREFIMELYKRFLDLLEDITKSSSQNSEKLIQLKLIKTVLNKL